MATFLTLLTLVFNVIGLTACSVQFYHWLGKNNRLIYTLNEDGQSYSVANGSMGGDLVIPSTYKDLPVTSIGFYVFSGCNNLIFYCEAASKPSGWNGYWNEGECPVVWDYKNQ